MDLRPEQKAAALMIAVGDDVASSLLGYLDDEEVEALAVEIAQLERIDPAVLESVLDEATREASATASSAVGGMDYVRRLLSRWNGDIGSEIMDELTTTEGQPFKFVRTIDPQLVVGAMEEEHPQTLAVVVAHQPPSIAARLLGGLPEAVRGNVAIRVARMGRVAKDVIQVVEESLIERLEAMAGPGGRQRGGVRGLAKVLNSSDKETERAILEDLSQTDPNLAKEVRSLMFVFDDIVTLDDRAIQRVLADVDTQTLAVALKGAPDDLSDRITSNMSQRARDLLLEEIDLLGPVPRKDIDAARESISTTVLALADAEEVIIGRSGGEIVE